MRVGRLDVRTAGLGAVGALLCLSAVSAGAATARVDDAASSAEMVAGVALFVSALLLVVVALARTRLAAQQAEIRRLRERTAETEVFLDLASDDTADDRCEGCAWCGSSRLGSADPADRVALEVSQR